MATTTGLEQHLAVLEARLNELFDKVDERFTQQTAEVQSTGIKTATLAEQFQGITNEVAQMPERVKAVIAEQQTFVMERNRTVDETMARVQDMMNQLNNGLSATRGDLNAVQAEVSSGSARPSGGGQRSLIDPKTFTLTIFDGDKNESKQTGQVEGGNQ